MNTVRGRDGANFAAAAALLVCAAALSPMAVEPAHAHGAAPVTRNVDDAAAPVVRNRWGANYFPNVELTTQDGKTVRFYEDLLKGKSVAINLIFTDCKEVCPLETANLVQVQRVLGGRVGKDIFFYSISIDPTRDTPEVLKAYAEKFGAAGPGWLFLTGKPEDIKLIASKLGMIRARDAGSNTHHAAQLIVGNEPSGQWTKNSAIDNPQFLAARMGTFLGWRDTQPGKSYAEARPLTIDNGQRLFQSRCSACHSIGQGDKLGPDLLGVTAKRERAWLTRYIQAPDEVLAAGDPIATALFKKYEVRMPKLSLAPSEVAAVVSYLEARASAPREKSGKHSAHAR